MFDKIITVTLNPAIDATFFVDELDFNEPVSCKKRNDYPGGKGINVSRTLTALGVPNTALFINGSKNSYKMKELLDAEGICYNAITAEGEVRESLTLQVSDGRMLKVNTKGFGVSSENLQELENTLHSMMSAAKKPLLIFAGSLPQNMTKPQYMELILRVKEKGAEIVQDNSIFTLEDYMKIKPFLIKPNQVELAYIFSQKHIEVDDVASFAEILSGCCTHVLVSLGGDGVFYGSSTLTFAVKTEKVNVKSTVGAGDSTLAGFIAKYLQGNEIKSCVRYATACGTASVTLDGTQTVSKELVEKFYNKSVCS